MFAWRLGRLLGGGSWSSSFPARGPEKFDVFMSYSHDADEKLASDLQRALSRLAKPWNQPRAIRVFRDRTDLSAAHDLPAEIESALSHSRYFLLLASPTAASSAWVGKEVDFWRRNGTPDTFLIAMTDGVIAWGDGDFDWTVTTALPRSLRGYFDAEPHWVSLAFAHDEDIRSLRDSSFRRAVASLASRPRGVPMEQLDSADVSAHRRSMRWRRTVVAGLVVLLVLSIVAGVGFLLQRNEARKQRDIAISSRTDRLERRFGRVRPIRSQIRQPGRVADRSPPGSPPCHAGRRTQSRNGGVDEPKHDRSDLDGVQP